MRTSWGGRCLRRFALVDDRGDWVSSAKRYLLPVCLDGSARIMCGLGAVFTRPEARGEGHAATLIEQLVTGACGEGASVAGLFSEIGEPFYQRLGFCTVP